MTLIPTSELRNVTGITEEQERLIRAYLQGMVYSWVKNRPGEQFAACDLVGGENFEWEGTPLQPLYEKHIALGKSVDGAIDAAAIDLGWLMKSVLAADRRHFDVGRKGLTAGYRWIGGEP